MIENPALPTLLGDIDGVVISVDPRLVVRLTGPSGSNVAPVPAGDVVAQWFNTGTAKPRVGDRVRLTQNAWSQGTWTVSHILATAPPPPAPRRCGLCGTPMVDGHDEIVCSLTPVEAGLR
jgi:hypothetical protein